MLSFHWATLMHDILDIIVQVRAKRTIVPGLYSLETCHSIVVQSKNAIPVYNITFKDIFCY